MDSFSEAPERGQVQVSGTIILVAVVVVALLLLAAAVDFWTEWLWFGSLGYDSVFATNISGRLVLFVAGAVVFAGLFAANVLLARRLAYAAETRPGRTPSGGTWEDVLAQLGAQMAPRGEYAPWINSAILVGGLVLALFMGLLAAGNWLTALQVIHRAPFDLADPVFGQDIGFYVFLMPALRAVQGWLLTTLVLIVLSVLGVYLLVFSYELAANVGEAVARLSRGVRGHLLGLAAVAFGLIAANHVLDLFDVVRSQRGAAYGAGFTDIYAQVPAQYVLAVTAILAGALCVWNIWAPGFRLAATGAVVWGVSLVVVGWMFPTLRQSIDVTPNELARERPYIERNIQFTRHAFGLDRIEDRDIVYEESVLPEVAATEQATINNIRLWDHRPLLDTFNQIQAIRQYYQFTDVDVDRYVIDGQYRQVMVGARELVTDQLPAEAQSWVSRQLQYTHGYGVAMAAVNEVSQEGLPELFVQNVPPVGVLPVTRPEVYFGEKTDHYVITGTSTAEFDYPRGDENVFIPSYGGEAGINLGSLWTRLLFAVKFQDPNFLLNTSILPDSQLLYRRDIQERMLQIAPFLRLDEDPYIVIADGALYWIQDAYTVSDRYPYSQPYQPPQPPPGQPRSRPINYIRNSVKIVTSAYDGSMRFYVADPSDPIIQTYQRIYPGLFVSQDEASQAIRAHFRYPEDLFRVQSQMLSLYHMQDPRVFYLREDVWRTPDEIFLDRRQPMEPYYVIMKLPGEAQPEFLLMYPFIPGNRENMIGWFAARSDAPNYGRLVVFEYPKDQ
ncbi:MAG: UPF0182 family protein, partial [Chloroflexi bacterium]|nr:UPF0182 family protein [Chloroflexota bacterium]